MRGRGLRTAGPRAVVPHESDLLGQTPLTIESANRLINEAADGPRRTGSVFSTPREFASQAGARDLPSDEQSNRDAAEGSPQHPAGGGSCR